MWRNFGKIFTRGLTTETTAKTEITIQQNILNKLKKKYGYNLIHAEVNNLSWKHDKPKGAETHLELILVTTEFEGVKKSQREEIVKDLLKDETSKIESLTTKLLTPSKWYDSNQRGLKLKEIYTTPPVFDGKIQDLIRNANSNKQQQTSHQSSKSNENIILNS